jgi:Tol biopolymer transport system component
VPSRFKESSEQPAWSPDGSVIVFTYDARTPDEVELGASQLWLYSLATKEVRYLTEGHFASWSPSGETLVYTLGSALWTINVASGEKQPLSSFDLTFQPRWSPTSQTILFVRWAPSQGLWAIEADGSNLRELGIGSFSADWAPEGTSFVCTSPGLYHLLKGTLLGTPPDTLIASTPSLCNYPRWAPDGSWIAYYRFSGGFPEGLWIVRSDGTGAHEIIAGGRRSSWSPDGTQIVYESHRPGTEEYTLWLYSIGSDKSEPLFGE